ncbi:protein GAMETE EXPRESSED 3-like [Oryza brachyantha]|uniref:protein GAMETE EXPRESSED 3-like n=1 Tax=Oryza brachyantha TaxID=4533 RepID=UPI001ADAF966|nr:protein GAMETE EXPRESSED 3-like [Oryza brachyantha]
MGLTVLWRLHQDASWCGAGGWQNRWTLACCKGTRVGAVSSCIPTSTGSATSKTTHGSSQEFVELLVHNAPQTTCSVMTWKGRVTINGNGISIGSLDGTLYSISRNGGIRRFLETTARSLIHANPVLDCSGFSVYISQIIMEAKLSRTLGDYTYVSVMKSSSVLFSLLTLANGRIHWIGNYSGELSIFLSSTDLNSFVLDETIVLTVLSAARTGSIIQCYMARQRIPWTYRKVKANFRNDSGVVFPIFLPPSVV